MVGETVSRGKALLSMDGDKASGQDGFTIAIFQLCWVIVQNDLMRVLHNFHEDGLFEKSLNATFIVKFGLLEVRDFIPISLVGSVYKILAIRMKQVLGSFISINQNAFIE